MPARLQLVRLPERPAGPGGEDQQPGAIRLGEVVDVSEIVGKSIKDLQIRRDLGVIVLAIRKHDGAMIFNPPADTTIHGSDCLIAMGRVENLRALEALVAAATART